MKPIREGSTTIVTGALGSGKTLLMVEEAMEFLALGGEVMTNIPLRLDPIEKWMRDSRGRIMDRKRVHFIGQTTARGFEKIARRGSMLVLDEAALDFNSRDWKARNDTELGFMVLCRKLKIHLLMGSQMRELVDKQMRDLMQYRIECRNLAQYALWAGIRLPLFIRIKYLCRPQAAIPAHQEVRENTQFRYGSFAFGCYDTLGLHGEAAEEFLNLPEAVFEPLPPVPVDYPKLVTVLSSAGVAAAAGVLLAAAGGG